MTRKMLPAGRGVAGARTQARRGLTRHRCATALLLVAMSGSAYAAQQDLLKPAQLIADGSLPAATRAANEYVARQYATFWNTGDAALARAALAKNFIDKPPRKAAARGRKERSSPPERFARRCRIYAVMSNK